MREVLIDGAWVDACATAAREIHNPATLAPLGAVPECGAADVARAVAAARAALPRWREAPETERAQRLAEVGARIRARGRDIALLVTQESGKPLCESLDDVDAAAACFEHHAESAFGVGGAERRVGGVVAAIGSFDSPLVRIARTAAPVIAAGGTVVCKPPHENPLSSLMLADAYGALPRGVVNVITGGIDTGSVLLHEAAAGEGEPRADADSDAGAIESVVVLADADLDLAVAGVAWSRLRNAGQNPAAPGRIYVERAIAAAFADRIHEYVGFLEVGDPMKPDTDLGPLISHEAARRVEGQVAYAVKDGARLKLGGRTFRPWGLPGHFFQPTILTDVRRASAGTREPIAGPVLVIIPVADAAEAIGFAIDDEPRNAAIYTNDRQMAMRIGAHVEHVTRRKPQWFPYRDR